jgi:epoxyqueuosine reductase
MPQRIPPPHTLDRPASPAASPLEAAVELRAAARELGFTAFGVAPARVEAQDLDRLEAWLAAGRQASMDWLGDRARARGDATSILPGAKSVVMVALPYQAPSAAAPAPGTGRVATYAQGGFDYHRVLRVRLELLVLHLLALLPGANARRFCDTTPVLERAFARAAGLGFVGKNTMLIHPRLGSTFVLGGIAVDRELSAPPRSQSPGRDAATSSSTGATPSLFPGSRTPDRERSEPHTGELDVTASCGTCTRCLDACPTAAFPAPYTLDAGRCISYLTIEHVGAWPEALRAPSGTHVFGCDICQAVCPWNEKFAPPSDPDLAPDPARAAPDLAWLADQAERRFKAIGQDTPWERTGKRGFLRNVAAALGNAGDPAHRGLLERLAGHDDPGVAEHARWSLERLGRDSLGA